MELEVFLIKLPELSQNQACVLPLCNGLAQKPMLLSCVVVVVWDMFL